MQLKLGPLTDGSKMLKRVGAIKRPRKRDTETRYQKQVDTGGSTRALLGLSIVYPLACYIEASSSLGRNSETTAVRKLLCSSTLAKGGFFSELQVVLYLLRIEAWAP